MIKIRHLLCAIVTAATLAACQSLPELDRPQSSDVLPEKIFQNVKEMGRSAVVDTGLARLAKKVAFDFSRPVAGLAGTAGRAATKLDMSYMDKDGDLKLTLDEYRDAMTPSGEYRLEASRYNLTVERFVRAEFYITDVNQDGFVDSSELVGLRLRDLKDKRDAILNYRPY